MKIAYSEMIRAATPLALIGMGLYMAVTIFSNPTLPDARFQSGLGFATLLITTGAALAQTSKNGADFSVTKHGNDLNVESPIHDDAANS